MFLIKKTHTFVSYIYLKQKIVLIEMSDTTFKFQMQNFQENKYENSLYLDLEQRSRIILGSVHIIHKKENWCEKIYICQMIFTCCCVGNATEIFQSTCAVFKQEAHRPYRSPEYQRLYTDFLSEGLIFVYQQPHHRIMKINR